MGILAVPAEIGPLKVYVLSATHAINSVASILAFALLVLALVAAYDREARPAGALGVVGLSAAIIGTVFMAGDWWYEAPVESHSESHPKRASGWCWGRTSKHSHRRATRAGIGNPIDMK